MWNRCDTNDFMERTNFKVSTVTSWKSPMLIMKCCIHRALNRVHANSFHTSQRTLYVPYKDQWLITLCQTRTVYYRNLTEHTTTPRALQKTLLARLRNFITSLWTGSTRQQNHTDWNHKCSNHYTVLQANILHCGSWVRQYGRYCGP
jgi:hypothetical protein